MLDGKFSVYNGNGDGGQQAAGPKRRAPVNFKYESLQSVRLSFEDELRQSMQKFEEEKKPSPIKVALQNWVKEGTSKLFSSNTLPKAPKKAPKPTVQFLKRSYWQSKELLQRE